MSTHPPHPRVSATWPYFDRPGGRPLGLAHRGGSLDPVVFGIENTLAAFRHAVNDLGITHIETDVRATADGVAVILHDKMLDEVSDASGPIADHTLADLEKVRIGGREPIPTLAEALAEFPDTCFNIDLKCREVVGPAVAAIVGAGAEARTCLASFSGRRIRSGVRKSGGRIASSHGPIGILVVLLAPSWRWLRPLVRALAGQGAAVQVPEKAGPFRVVSKRSVRRAHALGKQVHVWTIDEASDMRRLIALEVDGLITDRPDVLVQVLGEPGPDAPQLA